MTGPAASNAEIMPTTNATWTPAEGRLVGEYLAVRFPDVRTAQRVRVGSYAASLDPAELTPGEARMLGVWRRWVDAVVFLADHTLLIEAAIVPDPGDVAQLDLYRELWPMTPEYRDRRELPVLGRLVYAVDDPPIKVLASRWGFTVDIFRPPWIDEYLSRKFPRQRRAPQTNL